MRCSECDNVISNDAKFCPYCGRITVTCVRTCSACLHELPEQCCKYCPYCGNHLVTDEAPTDYTYMSDGTPAAKVAPRKKRGTTAVAVVAILVAAVLLIGIVGDSPGSNNEHTDGPEDPVDPDIVYEPCLNVDTNEDGFVDYYINGSGALTEEILGLAYDKETGKLLINLDEIYSANYGFYNWTFTEEDHTAYVLVNGVATLYSPGNVAKAEPTLYWSALDIGKYTVSVDCYASEEDYNTSGTHTTYTAQMVIDGDINYNWTYDGHSYNITFALEYKDFQNYKEKNTDHRAPTKKQYSECTNFVTGSDINIISLADSLKYQYLAEYGAEADVTGIDFANFILAFVQLCIYYPSSDITDTISGEEMMYGVEEYFAYPLETIFYGMGDCEDTSFLTASLFAASGYHAAVAIVQGHAMAGVNVDDYIPVFKTNYKELSVIVDGITYYICETTPDGFTIDVGLCKNATKYYEQMTDPSTYYGMFPVTSS